MVLPHVTRKCVQFFKIRPVARTRLWRSKIFASSNSDGVKDVVDWRSLANGFVSGQICIFVFRKNKYKSQAKLTTFKIIQ